jgi:hypothetical protein
VAETVIDKNPEHLEQTTREHINLLSTEFRRKTNGMYYLDVFETWRSGTRQAIVQANGASALGPGLSKHNITDLDGHPHAHACDLRVVNSITGTVLEARVYSEWLVYEIAGKLWESYGGIWGGRWTNPCDPGHFEAPGTVIDLKAGIPPRWRT